MLVFTPKALVAQIPHDPMATHYNIVLIVCKQQTKILRASSTQWEARNAIGHGVKFLVGCWLLCSWTMAKWCVVCQQFRLDTNRKPYTRNSMVPFSSTQNDP